MHAARRRWDRTRRWSRRPDARIPLLRFSRSTSFRDRDLRTTAPRAAAGRGDDGGQHPTRLPQDLRLVPILDHPRPLDELDGGRQLGFQCLLQPGPAPHAEMVGLDRGPRRRPAAEDLKEGLVVGALHPHHVEIRGRDSLPQEAVHGLHVAEVDGEQKRRRLAFHHRDAGARAQVEKVEKMRQSRDDQRVETAIAQLPPHGRRSRGQPFPRCESHAAPFYDDPRGGPAGSFSSSAPASPSTTSTVADAEPRRPVSSVTSRTTV